MKETLKQVWHEGLTVLWDEYTNNDYTHIICVLAFGEGGENLKKITIFF